MTAPNKQQTIIWNDVGMFYWCIYASFGVNDLNHPTYSDYP